MRMISGQNQVQIMKETRIFSGFSKGECLTIWNASPPSYEKIPKGQVVYDENDLVQHIGLLGSGALLGSKVSSDGSEHLIDIMLPKETIGLEIVCTPSQKCPMRIYASMLTEIWWFPKEAVFASTRIPMELQKKLLDNIIQILANENVKKLHKIQFLTQKNLREKIMAYLLRISEMKKRNSFTIQMNREQLAQYLDVNRSALSHELSQMQKDGLIKFKKNYFSIIGK